MMKIRNGFVSNSSSSAFILKMSDLTMEQLENIVNEFSVKLKNGEVRSRYTLSTDDVRHFLESIGVSSDLIRWTNVE
jgi:DNA-binding transcriptional regulator WhiA